MKDIWPWLFYLFLSITCIAIGMYLTYMIGESDLPFWVKLWLLSK